MNVLLVYQDDPKGANAAVAALQEAGHAHGCITAEELLRKGPPSNLAELIIVFAETYKEKETASICQRLRESTWASDIPLLVAVNMYQMPLANQVKALSRAHFIFTPLNPDDLDGRLEMMTSKQSPTTDA